MTFAGERFTEEIVRQSQSNVVQIEVSFFSTRCHNDNYFAPFLLYAYEHCMAITYFR